MAWPSLVERKLPRNRCEEVSNILSRLGRGFKKEEAGFFGVGFGVGGGNGSLVRLFRYQIELVTSKGDDDVFVCLALELLDPGLGLV
jgi:hypothetical protein